MVTFKPDASIFTVTEYDYTTLANRLRDLAYLNAGITLTLTDMRNRDAEGNPMSETFYSSEGLKEFVQYIDSNKESLINDVIDLNVERQGIPVEVAFTYNNNTYNENIYSFVNNINTIEGGTHLTGFRRGLTSTSKKYAEDNNPLKNAKVEINSDDFREGLTAVISVKVMEPQFEGQTKTKLGNSEVMGAVQVAVSEAPAQLSGRTPQAGTCDCRQGDTGRSGTSCRIQRPPESAAQVAPVERRSARQTHRLLIAYSRRLRTVYSRG